MKTPVVETLYYFIALLCEMLHITSMVIIEAVAMSYRIEKEYIFSAGNWVQVECG